MNSVFTYRLCDEGDCRTWVELNREFMAGEMEDGELWDHADQVSDEKFAETFHQALAAKEMIHLLLFEEDGKPVGFANLLQIFSVWSHGFALVIDDLYLRENCRGKGYGRRAMDMMEAYACSLNCRRLQFQSELTNPDAMKFYMAVGYQPADMKFYVKYLK